MTKRLKSCASCGSNDIITHETGGIVLIICQNCGKQVKHKGEREEAERIWNDKTGSD